jgi:hypothetical protein
MPQGVGYSQPDWLQMLEATLGQEGESGSAFHVVDAEKRRRAAEQAANSAPQAAASNAQPAMPSVPPARPANVGGPAPEDYESNLQNPPADPNAAVDTPTAETVEQELRSVVENREPSWWEFITAALGARAVAPNSSTSPNTAQPNTQSNTAPSPTNDNAQERFRRNRRVRPNASTETSAPAAETPQTSTRTVAEEVDVVDMNDPDRTPTNAVDETIDRTMAPEAPEAPQASQAPRDPRTFTSRDVENIIALVQGHDTATSNKEPFINRLQDGYNLSVEEARALMASRNIQVRSPRNRVNVP